jgi:hypothetical protein
MTCKKPRLGHIGLLLLASVILLPGSAGAQQPDTVKLYLNYLPHRLTETSGKQYDLLLDVALSGKLAQVPRGAAPLNRARALFLGDTGSCLFPTNIMGLDAGDHRPPVGLGAPGARPWRGAVHRPARPLRDHAGAGDPDSPVFAEVENCAPNGASASTAR